MVDYDPSDVTINAEYPSRDSFGGGVISDPDAMALMIKQYWGKIWAKRPGAPSLGDCLSYLTDYHTRVPAGLHPSFPNWTGEAVSGGLDSSWLEVVLRVIKESNDSCAGPDGVPFAVYRALPSLCGQFILEILIDMAKGFSPPSGFNLGNLYLIPKDESGLVLNHRPISVNNSENRLVASVLAAVIAPICQAALQPSQKGFIPGRSGADHIISLTDQFYSAVANRQPLYELKIDTKKAFDSVDHVFIEAVITCLGFLAWLVSLIMMLYRDAYITPVLSGHNHVLIPVRRGVKQGCPLSPLMFAICYDPLLVYLSRISIDDHTNKLFAFADDLVAGSSSLAVIDADMAVIDVFSVFSGLGVNQDKSEILCAILPSARIRARIRQMRWGEIRIVEHFRYLGILTGRKVGNRYLSVDDIFAGPLAKLEKRVRTMRPLLATRPLHHRIIGVNVFLLSLFSYHYQFYVPTRLLCEKVERLIRPLLVPFRGTAFRLQALYLGRGSGHYGPPSPLKDLYSLALTAMANRHDIGAHDGEARFLIPGFDYSDREGWRSLSVSVGVCFAAHDLVFLTHNETEGPVRSTGWDSCSHVARKKMYTLLVSATWGKIFSSPGPPPSSVDIGEATGHHITRGAWWGLDPAQFAKMTKRWVGKDMLAPPYLLAHHFRMWTNALPTGERLSKFKGSPLSSQPHTCYLCGADGSPGYLDSTRHLLSGACPVVSKARERFFRALTLIQPLSLASSFLAQLTDQASKTRRRVLWLATLAFNWCLYQARRRLFMTLATPPEGGRAVRSLTSYVLAQWNRMVRASKNKFIARLAIDSASMGLVQPLRAVHRARRGHPHPP